jgi:hypothetical protein
VFREESAGRLNQQSNPKTLSPRWPAIRTCLGLNSFTLLETCLTSPVPRSTP